MFDPMTVVTQFLPLFPHIVLTDQSMIVHTNTVLLC